MPTKTKKNGGKKTAEAGPASATALGPDEKQKLQGAALKTYLKGRAESTLKAATRNKKKIIAKWLPVMRGIKLQEIRKNADDYISNREIHAERADARLEMKDLDLDDAAQHQHMIVSSHKVNIKKLLDLQSARMHKLEQKFREHLSFLQQQFQEDIGNIAQVHSVFKQELELIVQQIEKEETLRAHEETTEHNTQYELIRNRNIEADHLVESALDEQIESLKERCDTALQNYRSSTDANAHEYKKLLQQDVTLSREVDTKLKQVEKLQAAIAHWKAKLAQNRQECESRNEQMKVEIEQLRRHCKEMKARMNRARESDRQRLVDLSTNARECKKKLTDQLNLAERILRTAELCRKYETPREKIAPLPAPPNCTAHDVDWNEVSEALKEEILEVLGDDGTDEWTYLDNFLKRYNRVLLDKLAYERRKKAVEEQTETLKSRLNSFVQNISIDKDTMTKPNSLLLVNAASAPS
ncbi:UNVERIFIED_CONTAM: flagellar associated protein [Hammondia hammondi]|eukprot:XP_008888790.1 flagellar associated protein [Hammondia hammondi]